MIWGLVNMDTQWVVAVKAAAVLAGGEAEAMM